MIFENKRFRQFTYAFVLFSILFLLCLWFLAGYMAKRADDEYRNYILEFTDESDASYLQTHHYILSYDKDINSVFVRNRWILVSFVFFLLVCLYGVCYIMARKTFGRVRELSEEMIHVLETGEVSTEELYEEGVIGQLDNAYHKLVGALKQSRENEMKEKEFLRDVLQDISHQLKTPIAAMVVFQDLLLEDKVQNKAEEKKILLENQRQLQRMEWLVLSMLKMAKLEADSIQFDMTDRKLLPTIEMAVSAVRTKVEKQQHRIQIQCDPDIHFRHDSDWMAEALINILNNAVDHMDEGGRIEVRAEDTDVFVRITVKDYGHGISEEELPHIFERFHRGKNNHNPNSVGIGLSLTKAIVHGQKGSISVRSEEYKYTEFQITFMKK